MILVTGASGFLGQHLVRYLSEQGHAVRALYFRCQPDEELSSLKNVSWQQCDLLDVFAVEEVMEGITQVYHCAGIVSFERQRKEELLHFNVESTANIVNEALLQNVDKLLYVSSVAALGRAAKPGEPISEDVQWEESGHYSSYGLSKYMAEIEVWRGMAEGLNAVIINPATILGEGSNWDQGSARLIKVVYSEFPFYTEGITGWVDVQDVVKASYMLMQSEIRDERFIISAGNHAYKEIFTTMAREMGRKAPHIRAGRLLSGLVWRWNEFRNTLWGSKITVTKETARAAGRKVFYNNRKLMEFLPGFEYQPVKTTIARMAAAYLNSRK
ncbi:NAD-dependent epimerase/dehydratase family protein [Polluticoccus soli]|uniref:NAD-dependent epimerase/dehydratase family protein n=1 Tax=Polluticoccus soli TaxID=3034150 RepID=UPI0023E2530E|nr:NAD-dependent epimerase/dehydratase family protein [Flavipsychrobacter sp. JY13-12]